MIRIPGYQDEGDEASKHFKQRAKERHGILSDKVVAEIVADIQSNKAIYISAGSDKNSSVYAVLMGQNVVPVVYGKKSKKLVTVMHKSAFFKQLKRQLLHLRYRDQKPWSQRNDIIVPSL